MRETYKWLVAPIEEFVKGKPTLNWEVVSVSPTSPNLIQAIEEKLPEEEWMIYEWSPIHLRNMLKQWYLKEGVNDVSAMKVWQDSSHYLYLPRLVNDNVFRNAMSHGVESEDYFAFASGKEGDRYLGFTFGRGSISTLDDSSLLIEREAAVAYRERTQQNHPAAEPGNTSDIAGGSATPTSGAGGTVTPTPPLGVSEDPGAITAVVFRKQFYGTISLDPLKATMGISA